MSVNKVTYATFNAQPYARTPLREDRSFNFELSTVYTTDHYQSEIFE
jgi:hypothetical protein